MVCRSRCCAAWQPRSSGRRCLCAAVHARSGMVLATDASFTPAVAMPPGELLGISWKIAASTLIEGECSKFIGPISAMLRSIRRNELVGPRGERGTTTSWLLISLAALKARFQIAVLVAW